MRRDVPVQREAFLRFHPTGKLWSNDRYVVIEDSAGELAPDGWTWLSIRRQDRSPRISWRDLQRIKNDICGEEAEAIEVYPAESRLIDGANQRHLWVLKSGTTVGVGWTQRSVLTPEAAEIVGRLTGMTGGRQS
jgi:hypothetical protein